MYSRTNPSLLDVIDCDDTLPSDPAVRAYWVTNLRHPFRLTIMHFTRLCATLTLCTAYFLKRLFPVQFCAHRTLQGIICWFMKWFVLPEANYLIVRHFWTESNIINFIIANSKNKDIELAALYPRTIDDFMEQTFIQHDIVLMNALHDLGSTEQEQWPVPKEKLDFTGVRPVDIDESVTKRRWTQCFDFETAHELFKTTFCLLLKSDEYERSINSLQFDQTLALRVSRIVGDPEVAAWAYNGFPMFLVGPLRLSQRFVMHGLFTEHLHAYIERLHRRQMAVS